LELCTSVEERDFMVLEETMRLVEGGGEVERESGGSTWKS
jgi:hypothetical protein